MGLRNALSVLAMVILIGGPVLALLGIVSAFGAGADSGSIGGIVGNAVRLAGSSVIGGGVLRLLISIDTRLEARV